ncbi:MAG TPA: PAS domain S-box protein [Steroidobacteraceae bacterium]|nr:PAS domain S-box protein [Steroidobacteraceae bacterium]
MNVSSRAFSPVSASDSPQRTAGFPADSGPADGANVPADSVRAAPAAPNSLFRLMAQSWPGAVLLLDRELSTVWMNGQAATLTGRTAGELIGVPWSELSLPWIAGAELRARLLSGERLHLECLQRGGRHVSGTLIPLQEAGAEVSAIACVLTEITPHQQSASERDYAASQRRLEAALESAQGGMWDLDLTQRAARRTESYFRMLGDTPHDNPVGMRSWRARVHPDDLHRVESTAQAVIEGRRPFYEAEYRYRHADGSWRWLLDRGRVTDRDATGKATRMVGFVVDITDRVRTQQALLQSEFRYRTVASMAPGFVFEHQLSEDGTPEPDWASEGIEGVFGCKYEEIADHGGWLGMIDDQYRPIALARQARLAMGEAQSGETKIHTVRGEVKWLHVHMLPVRDPQTGRVTGVLGSAYDITTRKLAEQALLNSEAVLRAVTQNTPDWLFLVDTHLIVRFVNRQFGTHVPGTMVGQRLLDFVPEAHRQSLQELYRRVLVSGKPGQIELRHSDAEGHSLHHEHRVVPVIEGSHVRSLTVAVTDVTERQSQQDAMRTQARILQTMQEGVVLIDATSGLMKLINPMFARMFGYESEEELLGRSAESLFSTRTLQLSRAGRAAADATPTEVLPMELECTRKDGTEFVAACVLTPLRMGGANHWLAVFNDVTERKRLEREIIEISNREQQRIGSDLHDGLGQELTGIALMLKGVVAQLRKEGSAAQSDIEDVVTLVNNAVEGTRALARGLSPVSGERGVLAAALQALATRASERYGVRVELDTDPEEILRLSESAATHVYRIVQEALTNVIRHSSASEVEIRLYASAGDLHLTVDDNGRGFSQPDPESPGGLGLKIMQYRTQMLGGDLMIDTGVRGGASIHCSFPMERAAAAERAPALRPEER